MPHAMEMLPHSLTPEYSNDAVERMYVEWDAALSSNDPERLLACYAANAVLESPLVPHLMGTDDGPCRGHEQLRESFTSWRSGNLRCASIFAAGFSRMDTK
jgi:ketosteroid isomerase-like protein